MDRFEAMRTLVAAVDGGSLSAASRMLAVPLPTVSRRVSDLEALLGSQLVVRTSRKLLLTEAGTAFVASARRVLAELAEAERAASGEYSAPRGELLVTAPFVYLREQTMPTAKKKPVRREWTAADLKALKMHSKARTPVEKISKATKRTIGALRVKASQMGISLGHQR